MHYASVDLNLRGVNNLNNSAQINNLVRNTFVQHEKYLTCIYPYIVLFIILIKSISRANIFYCLAKIANIELKC